MANQLKKKFIGNDQIDSTKILLENSTSFRSKKADGTTEVELLKIDGNNKVIIHKEGGAEEVGYKSQVDTVASDLASEITRATAAEAQALVDAKAYTDAKKILIDADIAEVNTRVDNVLSNVDAVALNSLAEIVTAFQQADNDLNGAITSLAASASSGLAQEVLDRQAGDSALQAELDQTQVDLSSEVTRATGAESALSGRIDILETYVATQNALVKVVEKIVITQAMIDAEYVDLAHIVSPIASSIVLIDRLILHPGASEDYVMPTVGGVTRLTFKNELVGSGNQKLQVGDNIYVRYSYSV